MSQFKSQARTRTVEVVVLLYRPSLPLLSGFLHSLKNQRAVDLQVTLAYDGSPLADEAENLRDMAERFNFSFRTFKDRLGIYLHAERALTQCLSRRFPFVLADQDDWWLPNRLEQQLHCLEASGSDAVTSDALIYSGSHPTSQRLFELLNTREESLRYELICNHVTGTGTLFSPQVATLSTPFPPSSPRAFHDHWLGIVAVAGNGVFLDREVRWHYVQHEGNQVGVPLSVWSRFYLGFHKLWEVAFGRILKTDSYYETVLAFRQAITERFPNSIRPNSFIFKTELNSSTARTIEDLTVLERLRLSRFEVLRFRGRRYKLRIPS